mgnify:FL=1
MKGWAWVDLKISNCWETNIAEVKLLGHPRCMPWLLRRVLAPFITSSIVCTVLLLVWTTVAADTETPLRLSDAALASLFILPFEAIGLIILLPIALVICDRSGSRLLCSVLLVIVGSAIGVGVVLPIASTTTVLELSLPAACGAANALIWFAINRDAVRG